MLFCQKQNIKKQNWYKKLNNYVKKYFYLHGFTFKANFLLLFIIFKVTIIFLHKKLLQYNFNCINKHKQEKIKFLFIKI